MYASVNKIKDQLKMVENIEWIGSKKMFNLSNIKQKKEGI